MRVFSDRRFKVFFFFFSFSAPCVTLAFTVLSVPLLRSTSFPRHALHLPSPKHPANSRDARLSCPCLGREAQCRCRQAPAAALHRRESVVVEIDVVFFGCFRFRCRCRCRRRSISRRHAGLCGRAPHLRPGQHGRSIRRGHRRRGKGRRRRRGRAQTRAARSRRPGSPPRPPPPPAPASASPRGRTGLRGGAGRRTSPRTSASGRARARPPGPRSPRTSRPTTGCCHTWAGVGGMGGGGGWVHAGRGRTPTPRRGWLRVWSACRARAEGVGGAGPLRQRHQMPGRGPG